MKLSEYIINLTQLLAMNGDGEIVREKEFGKFVEPSNVIADYKFAGTVDRFGNDVPEDKQWIFNNRYIIEDYG